ncbi:MAG: TIGR03905 family TSCPD domain-containing protein [Oscillospiraceae bacterium]|nr:TIGR03905 family TSCPD domain-containing protein [Oscillospiraceae bacterium]
MKHEFTPKGVCAQKIEFALNDGVVNDVKVFGGCQGNGAGIAKLVEGMRAEDVISRLENIRCGARATSCPAQLAKALREAI